MAVSEQTVGQDSCSPACVAVPSEYPPLTTWSNEGRWLETMLPEPPISGDIQLPRPGGAD